MPKIIENPQDMILKHAKKIMLEEGYINLNIRRVAKSCNMAVGTIYNYFSTKEELISRMMVDYWEEYFYKVDEIDIMEKDFYCKLKKIYEYMEVFVNDFHEVWLKMNLAKSPNELKEGLKKRKDFIERLIKRVELILVKEMSKRAGEIKANISSYEISSFIILNFMMMTQMKQMEYESFEKIIAKVLE